MAAFRRSFRWSSEKKTNMSISIPRSASGFGFTVAWTRPPLVDFVHEAGPAEKAGLMPGDKILSIDKIPVSKKGKEEIENIVKNVKDILEMEVMRPEGELATRKRQTSLRRKESFTKKGSRMVIQDSQIMLWRKERALLKLLLCEEDLLNILLVGKERFLLPLRKHNNLVTAAELDILFGNIEEVGMVHEKNVQQLRQLTQGTDDNVGRLYQKQVDERLSVLRKYVSGLSLGRILYHYKFMNKPFSEFVEASQITEENTDLLFLIEKPLKYISDITSQLASLLTCTAVGHVDYVCLESIVSIYRSFENEMNEMMNKLSSFEDLENLETAFDGEEPYLNLETLQEKTLFTRGPKGFSLINPGRFWLFAGQLAKVEGRHYTQYWALLLSDCLVISRRTEQGVLLVLDEPVMLRSIYQIAFDVKKCDSEFRILFAVEPFSKSYGQRNQWTTWILRAPCAGIKLIWQSLLTQQLALFSAEALKSGKSASFVHSKQSLVLRGVLPKRNSKYEESSFMTFVDGPRAIFKKCSESSPTNKATLKESPDSIFEERREPEKALLRTARLEKHGKDGSYFCVASNKDPKKHVVTRSKSFGNDIKDSIPFIDCAEESNSGTESNIIYIREYKSPGAVKDVRQETIYLAKEDSEADDNSKSNSYYYSDPGTPRTSNRLVQTDESADSIDGSLGKRTPRKKFPRLGTFERIKLENRSATLDRSTSQPKACRTRTGTSTRHRRHLSSTVSKEQLLKSDSVSPVRDSKSVESDKAKESSASPSPRKSPRKYKRGFFSRLFKRGSNSSSIDSEHVNEGLQKELDNTLKDTEMVERKFLESSDTVSNEKVKIEEPSLDQDGLADNDDPPPPSYEESKNLVSEKL